MRSGLSWICVGASACAASETVTPVEPPLRALLSAADTDPDPRVVEITLVAVAAVTEYEDGVPTSVLAYRDGADPSARASVPGPLVEGNVGDRLVVHFINELPGLDTTIHWHGLRLPEAMDGNPMVSGRVPPGATFDYDFVLRDAGTFWYHPHVDTDEQMELGLQGPMIVHEPDPPAYANERMLVLDDVGLAPDGAVDLDLDRDALAMGRRDGVVIVNGAAAPASILTSPGATERWRIVNASNGRFFRLAADASRLRVIGLDAGAIADPYDVETLLVAPGERYELAVTLPSAPGRDVLRTLEVDRGHEQAPDPAADLLEIVMTGDPAPTGPPDPTRSIDPLSVDGATMRRIVLSADLDAPTGAAFFINGERWPLNTALPVQSGDVDVWEVVNEEPHHHPFHIHGLFFQVLARDGTPVPHLGWKDTTVIAPDEVVRLAVPYDEPGMWMYHCQIPEHAERGMMGDLMVAPRR